MMREADIPDDLAAAYREVRRVARELQSGLRIEERYGQKNIPDNWIQRLVCGQWMGAVVFPQLS